MKTMKIIAAAAVLSTAAATAHAGGLEAATPTPEITTIVETPPAPTGSINSGYIVLGVLAALVAASASF